MRYRSTLVTLEIELGFRDTASIYNNLTASNQFRWLHKCVKSPTRANYSARSFGVALLTFIDLCSMKQTICDTMLYPLSCNIITVKTVNLPSVSLKVQQNFSKLLQQIDCFSNMA